MSLEVRIKKKLSSFDLDVDLAAGNETMGLLDASGCGKSLTLRCIAGVETPDEGRIVVNDTVFFDSAKGINLSPQKRKTALLFQNYQLFPNMTVEANIAAGIDSVRAGRNIQCSGRDIDITLGSIFTVFTMDTVGPGFDGDIAVRNPDTVIGA